MPPIRNRPTPKTPLKPERPTRNTTPSAGAPETWTIGGKRMTVWAQPTRGPSELINAAYPAVYFTDGLKPRQRMTVSTPEGDIELVGIAKGTRPAQPNLPAPPPPSNGVIRPPAPPTRIGGVSSPDSGNFFNVRGGFSSNMYPEAYLRDFLGNGPDGYRATVGELMTVAEWKANGYPGGKTPLTEQQLDDRERLNRKAAAVEEKERRDTEEAELRQETLDAMTPEERQKYREAESETYAIENRRLKGYPFSPI